MTLAEGVEDMTVDGARTRKPIDGVDVRSILYFLIFPNTLVSLHPDYVMLHTLWPKAPDRTEVVCEWFFEPEAIDAEGFDPSDAVEFWDQVNREDWHVCGLTQRGMESPSFVPGRYTTQEDDVHEFDSDDRPALPRGPAMSSSNGHRATDFDAIVVGGGHNGLTAAAYLARAGLQRLRARAPRPARRRVRDRGDLARPPRLARVLRGQHAAPAGRQGPRAQALRLRPDPARPAVRDLRRRRHADPLPQRRGQGARVAGARVAEGRGDHAGVRGDDGARRRRPAADDAQAAARAGLQAPGRRARAAARGRPRRRAVSDAACRSSTA